MDFLKKSIDFNKVEFVNNSVDGMVDVDDKKQQGWFSCLKIDWW